MVPLLLVCRNGLDTVGVVSVAGSVGQATGSGRAVAVTARSTAGGAGALGIVRVATRAAAAAAFRGRSVGRGGRRRARRVWIGGRA